MSETVLTIEEAARCLSDLVERIHAKGEAAVLVKSGRPLARIVPVPSQEQVAEDLIAFLRRWRLEHPEPDEQLAEVIQQSRRAVYPPQDPWERFWIPPSWLHSNGVVSIWNDCSPTAHRDW